MGHPVYYLAAAAAVVTATVVIGVAAQAVVAAAAEQHQQDDDPPNVAATETVVTHRNYLHRRFSAVSTAHSMLFRRRKSVRPSDLQIPIYRTDSS